MLLGALSASLLGKILCGRRTKRAAERVLRTGHGNKSNKMDF